MAEQQGFFRRIFSFGQKPEESRVPDHGEMPRVNDTEAARPESPDPDLHQPAAAAVNTDTEAGADPKVSDEGGIEPLHPAAPGTAEKKTPN